MENLNRFDSIMEEISARRESINELRTERETLAGTFHKAFGCPPPTKRTEEYKTQWQDISEKLNKIDHAIKMENLIILFLQNNARLALLTDSWPILVEILKQYENKPCGEKTRQKITAAALEKAGVHFYIYATYGACYGLSPADHGKPYAPDMRMEIYADNYNQILDENNKIQIPDLENLYLSSCPSRQFVDDPPAAAALWIDRRAAMEKAMENLNALIDEYNAACPTSAWIAPHVYPKTYPSF